MPRWTRFLSLSSTGLMLSLVGFICVAGWWEGGGEYGRQVMDFLSTGAFWSLVWFFGLLAVLTLLTARMLVYLYGWPNALAGALGGALLAAVYVAFLIASHASDWGGLAAVAEKGLTAGIAFVSPFVVSGACISWLWDRLD